MKSVLQRFSEHYGQGFTIECEEWDICRSPDQDLLNEGHQQKLLARIKRGEFVAVLMSPPCASWSRAPWANRWGPRPLRTVLHPWGMPWLEGPKLEKVAKSNCMIRFCLRAITLVQTLGQVGFLLEHPENLGSVSSRPSPLIRPASIWELQEFQQLAGGQTFSVALYQCALGAKSRKPTRFLSNIPGLEKLGKPAWPVLDRMGRYRGPLPPFCSCGRTHSGLIKRSAEEAFSTTEAASYPPQMDIFIAQAIWKFAQQLSPTPSSPFGGGESQELGKEDEKEDEKKEVEAEKVGKERSKEAAKEGDLKRKRIEAGDGEPSLSSIGKEAEVEKLIDNARREAFAERAGRVLAPIKAKPV